MSVNTELEKSVDWVQCLLRKRTMSVKRARIISKEENFDGLLIPY